MLKTWINKPSYGIGLKFPRLVELVVLFDEADDFNKVLVFVGFVVFLEEVDELAFLLDEADESLWWGWVFVVNRQPSTVDSLVLKPGSQGYNIF